MSNPVVHFEILGSDVAALQRFYSNLFGWNIRNSADFPDYGVVTDQEEGGLSGGIGKASEGNGHVTFYVEVDDPDAYLARAQSMGGSIVAPTATMGGITFGLFTDPEGHLIGVAKSGGPGAAN